MSASASSYKRKKKANPWIAPRVRAISTFVLAILFLTGMICDADEQHHLPTTHATKSDHGSHAVVLTLADSKPIMIAAAVSSEDSRAWSASPAICSLESMPDLSLIDMPPQRINLIPLLTMQPAGQEILEEVGVMIGGAGSGSVDLLSYARRKLLPDFGTTYRALARRVALAGLRRVQDEPALAHTTVMGTVSTYNPFRGGKLEGGPETASGEIYDPTAWTAAIKTELRNRFRGVRYGRLYQPAFALVESGAKQLIVKINDVGPLRPGRVLDLNERSMRQFDPFLTRGLIDDVKITVLPGEDWIPGPVGSAYAIGLQDTQWRTASAQSEPSEPANQLVESETANAPIVYAAHPRVKTHILAEMVPNGGG